MPEALLSIRDLTVDFARRRRASGVRAVDNVSFDIGQGTTVALVGESGSGKSTIGNAVLGLVRITAGKVVFGDRCIADAQTIDSQTISRNCQVIFQDPYGSLNPSRTIGSTLAEPLFARSQRSMGRADRDECVASALEKVGLPRDAASRYPSEFSGGQRQRIAIARAMITEPALVVCDEPVSSLDLSIQAQVLNVLVKRQRELGTAYLFISHDLAVVRRIADEVVILYRGKIVERGKSRIVCTSPSHPYTRALLAAVPVPDPAVKRKRLLIKASDAVGPSPAVGCSFAYRCPFAVALCVAEKPELRPSVTGAWSACHRAREVALAAVSLKDES